MYVHRHSADGFGSVSYHPAARPLQQAQIFNFRSRWLIDRIPPFLHCFFFCFCLGQHDYQLVKLKLIKVKRGFFLGGVFFASKLSWCSSYGYVYACIVARGRGRRRGTVLIGLWTGCCVYNCGKKERKKKGCICLLMYIIFTSQQGN